MNFILCIYYFIIYIFGLVIFYGLSAPRAPQSTFSKKSQKQYGHEIGVVLRISTIFCMREAVTISNGSRILPCHLGLYNDLKNNDLLVKATYTALPRHGSNFSTRP